MTTKDTKSIKITSPAYKAMCKHHGKSGYDKTEWVSQLILGFVKLDKSAQAAILSLVHPDDQAVLLRAALDRIEKDTPAHEDRG